MLVPSEVIGRLADARMLIGGEWRSSSSGAVLPSVDPSTEKEIARIPDATDADVDDAVHAAHDALAAWRAMSPSQRGDRVRRLADVLERHEDELAMIDSVDSGNPLTAMRDDVRGGVRELRLFAGLVSEIKGSSVLDGADRFSYELREPYGVVGRIVAFNHPLKFAAGKTAAALVAGNTVVVKPSEHTSLSAIRLGQLAEGILPPGVFNVVTGRGPGAGAAIAAHPAVPRVAFTGGVPAGRAVLRAGAETIKHVTLELGGKNPMIVFPDADPRRAAAAAVKGMNFARSQGQSCQSNSRVFVHRDISAAFTAEVVALVERFTVGDPLEPGTDLGPLTYREHYERVMGYVDVGRREGATLLAGGERVARPGFFVPPTVFGDVDPGMTIAREEIFGPVLSLITWDDEEAVVAQANDTSFGLTANIWTGDLVNAHRTAHRIQAGYVWINGSGRRVPGTPFGGYKQSGLGKESSLEEILSYCQHKVIAVSLQD
ncbi:aldehyde dehydrogenase family protein [Actinotalea sp. Marseille-Q4924]|uniref:aldehyde dehydrogenase family protein n=1 Tax=Actinotalea sp. Marseille-Q4924 TaxID=2866571 RepID=UPI001CE45BCD|nr:aldehyde dehydrogenase family protein [Actinotalea sp. Marseille-Q4924]